MWFAWLAVYIIAQAFGAALLETKKDGLNMVEDIWTVAFLFLLFPGVIGFAVYQSFKEDEDV